MTFVNGLIGKGDRCVGSVFTFLNFVYLFIIITIIIIILGVNPNPPV